MKKTLITLLFCLVAMGSCSEKNATIESDTENTLSRNSQVEYLESSTGHKDKTFAAQWSVTKTVLQGGKQEGVELLTLDNGKLKITVIPTRGMGIFDVRMESLRLGWDSPVKEIVHPSYVDLESRGGLGWLEGFNEWMVRCGLEFAGHPGTDEFIDNTGGTATLDLTLHGKIQNIPASDYEITVDPDPPHRIRISGTVYEKFFYGPKLKLVTEVSTVPGSDTFQISDKLTNEGSFPQEFQLIYHGNYGSSILEEGAMVYAPAQSVTPMNENAAKAIDRWHIYKGPTPGFVEEVFLVEPLSDGNSSALALLTNATGDQATSVRWNVTELPYLTIWKNTAAEEDGYVTGIEPATGYPFNRKVERKYGRVPRIDSGETRIFTLNFGIHQGREAVDEMIAEATQRQAAAKITMNTTPPATE